MAISLDAPGLDPGGNEVRFDLTDLYTGIEDSALERDITTLATLCGEFKSKFEGKLHQLLGEALESMNEIQQLNTKISVYLHLSQACDAANQKVQKIVARARESWAKASADNLTFFEQEIGKKLSQKDYERQLNENEVVRQHKSFLDQIRKTAKYLLSEPVERALVLRAPFTTAEWVDYFDELEVGLTFTLKHDDFKDLDFYGKPLGLSRILNLMLHHPNSVVRYESMKTLNKGLKKHFSPLAAHALNTVVGLKNIEDDERGYPHALAERNIQNKVSDEVVEALHQAVITEGPPLARRYFRLLAAHLGKRRLLWSDRTALPFYPDTAKIPWEEGFDMVEQAYRNFSPFLADIVRRMLERRWIDAPPYEGKISGAFNYSVDLPEPLGVRSYTLLNYQGSERDVMVIAHELGHAVHGVLAAHEQGALMFRAPMAYAETASIFGENLAFEFLLKRSTSDEQRLLLLMEKCSEFISSVLRQISFSLFEKHVHLKRRDGKLTVDDFCALWLEVTKELFGADGDVFEYSEMEYLWSYVSHFLNPFYVYAYAFEAPLLPKSSNCDLCV